ncbi:MAG: hydantoinase B/oxoprolinase family protein, partial [Rhodospirillales bacterium]|nr:hydantoinase B/oxoprolinase family protein [Rhodospirillales bacterium]
EHDPGRASRRRRSASLSLWFERSVTSAWGLFGGNSGSAPEVVIEEPGREPVHCLKVNSKPLAAGTVITSRTGGGGGFGAAAERDPQAVRQDLVDGLVSPAVGKRVYGIESET